MATVIMSFPHPTDNRGGIVDRLSTLDHELYKGLVLLNTHWVPMHSVWHQPCWIVWEISHDNRANFLQHRLILRNQLGIHLRVPHAWAQIGIPHKEND